jgi:spore maturation protein CgeB
LDEAGMKILLVANKRRYGRAGKGYYASWCEELFREELIRTPKLDVYPFGWGYCNEEFENRKSLPIKIEELSGVDVILTSCSNRVYKSFGDVSALKVNIAKDFYDGKHRIERYYRHYGNMHYDIIFCYGSIVKNKFEKEKIGGSHYVLPFGVDIGLHRKLGVEKEYDVGCFYTTASKTDILDFRKDIHNKLKDIDISLWKKSIYYNSMVVKVNECRVCVNYSPYDVVNPRVTEVLACGTLLLTNYCEDYTRFGYKNGKHLVFYDGLDDLVDKIYYYLENDSRREKIAESGRRFVRKRYNNTRRVREMVKVIKDHL